MQDAVRFEVRAYRQADKPVDPIFLNRWSPRAFAEEPIDDETLWRVFEAARWAPSSNNEQPWRFIIARTPEDRARFVDFLMPGNQLWARHAPVLILVISKRTFSYNGSPNRVNQFDAGTAWGFLSLAAVQNGLITHGMAGFDPDRARELLEIPDDYDILATIALGKRGDASQLPEDMQAREVPSTRRPAAESVMEGRFQG
jgi:nitroreductase